MNSIISVKVQGSGWLLNNVMHVPGNADSNREYELIKQWLEEGNVPEPEFTEEELNQQRISLIKRKAGDIIISKYSIIWQLNHPRSDEAYKLDYEWIDSIRAISNKAELEGIALEDIDWGVL